MAKAVLPIPAFPADIDRRDFANWLTGFTDGEGCFMLHWRIRDPKQPLAKTPVAKFIIKIRHDDHPALSLIQSFWRCGRLYNAAGYNFRDPSGHEHPANPQVAYYISDTPSQIGKVIPHFLNYPLRAKKQNDFYLWKEGVTLIAARERRGASRHRFTERELAQFATIHDSLRRTRFFNAPPPQPFPPPDDDYPLFR